MNGQSHYVISSPNGIVKQIPLDQARLDKKLAITIARNGWEPVNGGK